MLASVGALGRDNFAPSRRAAERWTGGVAPVIGAGASVLLNLAELANSRLVGCFFRHGLTPDLPLAAKAL